jgi:hypothetical protein
MDIVSHGLWGGIAFGRSNKINYFLSVFFGLSPDLFSFGIFTALVWLGVESGVDWSAGIPPMSAIPTYVYWLYNITHSLVVASAVIFLIWLITKKIIWPLLAWPLHIIFDIFSHSIDFFPTPWLWPIKNYYLDGIAWSTPWVFFSNWALLFLVYGSVGVWLLNKKKNEKLRQNR